MASQPMPGSTDGGPRNPPAPSTTAAPRVSYVQRCVVLVDWWLERVEGEEAKIRVAGNPHNPQMRKGASSSKGNRQVPGRAFRSATIARRRDYTAVETEDGYLIRIGRLLNIPKTLENGFPEEVCKCFEFGFPIQWHELVNPNMEQQNEQAQSESSANAPRHSVEYYMEKFLSDSCTDPMRYAFTENEYYSSVGYTRNMDGPAIQSLSNLTDGNAGNMPLSWGLYGGRTNMPEKPLTSPGKTCSGGQESDQRESMQVDKQGIVNFSINSVSVNQSKGSMLAPYESVPVEKEVYSSIVDGGQAEEDADNQDENMQSCPSEQEMIARPIDSAIVNENLNSTSSDLGEQGTTKCGKASVNMGTTDALEQPTERMAPQFGAVRGSEDSLVRRLRSGKVFGTPSAGPKKNSHKQKKIQHEASSKNMAPNEGGTSTADLTSHENDSSAARVVTGNNQESHDSHSERRERLAKKKKKVSDKLFWSWV